MCCLKPQNYWIQLRRRDLVKHLGNGTFLGSRETDLYVPYYLCGLGSMRPIQYHVCQNPVASVLEVIRDEAVVRTKL